MGNKDIKKEYKLHPYRINILMVMLGGLLFYGITYLKDYKAKPNNGVSYTNSYFYKPRIGPVDESRKFNVGGNLNGDTDISNRRNSNSRPRRNNNNVMELVEKLIDDKLYDYSEKNGTSRHSRSIDSGVGIIVNSVIGKCPSGYINLIKGVYSGPKYKKLVKFIKMNRDVSPIWLDTRGSETVLITENMPDDFFFKIVEPYSLDEGIVHHSSINVSDLTIKVGSTDINMVLDGESSVISRAGKVSYDQREMEDVISSKKNSHETEPRHIRVIACMKY